MYSYISDGHSTKDMKFVWSENAVTMAESIEFPQFSIVKIKSYSCEKDYYGSKSFGYNYKFVLWERTSKVTYQNAIQKGCVYQFFLDFLANN